MERNQAVKHGLIWARFLSLAKLEWSVSSVPGFDINLTIPCSHSECSGSHQLLVRIEAGSPPDLRKRFSELFTMDEVYGTPTPAIFGVDPEQTYWQMSHGAGGGDFDLAFWVSDWKTLWRQAEGHSRSNAQR